MKAFSCPPTSETMFENATLGFVSVPFEHQVLKEMGDAGLAKWIIRSAVSIINHMGHHRGAVIGDHHDLQAVFQMKVPESWKRGHADTLRAPQIRGAGWQSDQASRWAKKRPGTSPGPMVPA